MAELTPDIAAVVRSTCETNAGETAEALSRALDVTIEVSVGAAETYRPEDLPAGWEGPGLLAVFKIGEIGAIGLIPEESGLLPDWYAEPDATGESKLTTLAQELSMLLVPEEFMADDFKAAKVDHLANALVEAEVTAGAGLVSLQLTAGEKSGNLTLVWPSPNPDAALKKEPPKPAAPEPPKQAPAPQGAKFTPANDFDHLPPYTRSLLRIKVPVMVTLASKKQSIHEIIELGAGSIIKFEKSCEQMLDLEVGGLPIAQGEAVKVGDKFGLRINSMILPGERFNKLTPKAG